LGSRGPWWTTTSATDPSWNTFSKEEADHQAKVTNGQIKVEKVIKMPLLDINDVMSQHFGGAAPTLLIDAEGWHRDSQGDRLSAVSTESHLRETLVSGTNVTIQDTPAFMTSQGYVDRGGSFVNTLFVDGKML
jgi:hypothetical protein